MEEFIPLIFVFQFQKSQSVLNLQRLKLGKGSTGSTGANGTGSKGGRMLKKGGVGARNCGGGRKDKFSHIKIRVKIFL